MTALQWIYGICIGCIYVRTASQELETRPLATRHSPTQPTTTPIRRPPDFYFLCPKIIKRNQIIAILFLKKIKIKKQCWFIYVY